MNGGFYGLRAKQITLILIALVFTSILLWRWENNPLLAAFLHPQELLIGQPSMASQATKANTSVVVGKEADLQPQKHHADTGSQKDLAENSSGIEKNEAKMAVTPGADEGNTSERDMVNGREEKHHVGEDVMPPAESSHSWERACDYAKGKWVEDNSWPLYPGFGCKQWLSGMWACRLNQRPDFAYEKFRWQPQDCVMEEFTGSKFLQRMQNKTLAFVGDSLGRQQFQSLMCMVTGGLERPDVLDVGWEYGLVKARGAKRPDGWAYRFPTTNTTILYYWSASLSHLQPLDPKNRSTDYAMHLDRPPAFLQRFLHQFHVLVLNTGHHWNRGKLEASRWVIYVGGKPNTDPKIDNIENAKNFTVHSIVNWVNSQLPKYPGLKAFYRSISPRHFFNGDWNTGGTCDNSTPLSRGNKVLQNESSDSVAARAVKGTDVKLLDITALSKLRDEGHVSRYTIRPTPGMQDCLHWCLPGIPDTWNHVLFQQI